MINNILLELLSHLKFQDNKTNQIYKLVFFVSCALFISTTYGVPTLGNYQTSTVVSFGNIQVVPDIAPTGTTSLAVYTTSSTFTGTLTANPLTGVIYVTNAKPAGTYTIIVNAGSFVTTTFTLNVTNQPCTFTGLANVNSNSVGTTPLGMAIGDFNRDGFQDIAIANSGSNNVSIRLGDGVGGFTSASNVTAGTSPRNIAVGDMNNDGFQDLLISNYNSNSVSVKFGNGTGAFSGTTNIAVGVKPTNVVIGDFNNDGVKDFACCNSYDGVGPNNGSVSIRLGNGIGGFTNATDVSSVGNPRETIIGDFNEDGNQDIATSSLNNGLVRVRFGNGAGSFSGTTDLSAASSFSLAVGDFNNDGHQDIAASSVLSNLVTILIGNGTGAFPVTNTFATIGAQENKVEILDFNGDGNQDLAVSSSTSNSVAIKTGDGSGGFSGSTYLSMGSNTSFVLVGDFNKDGLQDLVTSNGSGNNITFRTGTKDIIDVQGNGIVIPDGNITTSLSNNTNLDSAVISYSTNKLFTIVNRGLSSQVIDNISFVGTDAADFSLSGISLPLTIPATSSATFTINFSPVVAGNKNAEVHLDFTNCNVVDYDFAISAKASPLPALGNYIDEFVIKGGNTFLFPSAPPSGTPKVFLTVPSTLTGVFTIEPSSGIVRITNASPVGVYNIKINAGFGVSASFNLTVADSFCPPNSFSTPANISISTHPYGCAIGDFNRDNIQDLAISNFGSATVSIRLGNGIGGFNSIADKSVGTNPDFVAVGDFNSDGIQDLAVANYGSANVSILLGNGVGNFSPPTNISVGTNPTSITIADFNGDGNQDFATSNWGSNTISIRLGNGAGAFSNGTDISAATNPRTVVSTDMNNDLIIDLVVATTSSNSLSIKLGNGNGLFVNDTTVAGITGAYGIAITDLNADNNNDVIVSNSNGSNVYVLIGTGAGGINNTASINTGFAPFGIVTGDFNDDGFQDFATANTNSISVRLNEGSGTSFLNSDITTSIRAITILTGDLNNDRFLDLVTTGYTNNTVSVFNGLSAPLVSVKGNGNSITDGSVSVLASNNTDYGTTSLNLPITKSFTIQNTGYIPQTITDINITGVSDFTVSGITLPIVIPTNGSTTFSVSFTPTSTGLRSSTVHVVYQDCFTVTDYDFAVQGNVVPVPTIGNYSSAGVNMGGNITISPDAVPTGTNTLVVSSNGNFSGVLTADLATGNVRITNAKPAGVYVITVSAQYQVKKTFLLTVNNPPCSPVAFGPTSTVVIPTQLECLAVGDFNKDGKQDVAASGHFTNLVSIRLGNGSGGFTIASNVTAGIGTNTNAISISDFNSDGNQDLLIANFSSSTVSVRFGNGTGGFTGTTNVSVSGGPFSIAYGDFNNDGYQDFVSVGTSLVSIRLGNGAGGFTNAPDVNVGTNPRGVAVGDFNNDNIPDLAISVLSANSISIRLGTGSGTFMGSVDIPTVTSPTSLILADFNNDSKPDIAVISSNSSNVGIMLGDGSGNFVVQPDVIAAAGLISIDDGDLNGDGYTDLIIASQTSNNVQLRFGTGTGTFTGISGVSIASEIRKAAVGDFNNDGLMDIVAIDYNSNSLPLRLGVNSTQIQLSANTILINDGSNTFSTDNNTHLDTTTLGYPVTRTYSIKNNSQTPRIINSLTLAGPDVSEFSVIGISFPVTIPENSSIDFNITFTPLTNGEKNAEVHVGFFECSTIDYDFAIRATSIPDPVLGNYPPVSVISGGNIVIAPDAAPVGVTTLSADISKTFSGTITVDPLSGDVRITNAKPAGIYIITVNTAFHVTKTFTLTVTDPVCTQTSFTFNSTVSVGGISYSVAVGDFNNDGKQDFVSGNYQGSNSVSIRLGDGLGGFTGSSNISIGASPYYVTTADMNRDGNLDILTANYSANSVSVVFGNGLGGSSGVVQIPVGNTATRVATGDFNNDGYLDFATSNFQSATASVRLGNGNGFFINAPDVIVGNNPSNVVVGEFNNDGKADLAISNNIDNTISVKPGNGDGTFGSGVVIPCGFRPTYLELSDFNNDGIQDLAVTLNFSIGLQIFLGNGSGSFVANPNTVIVGNSSITISSADFNGDGNQDMVVTSSSANTVAIRFGDGTGSFTGSTNMSAGNQPGGIASGDFNSDGVMDFVVGNLGAATAYVHLGNSVPQIQVKGNGNIIPDGKIGISTTDYTDFGTTVASYSVSRTFTILNNAVHSQTINSINFTGVDIADFSFSGLSLPATIPAGGTATFNVNFLPSTVGTKIVTAHIGYAACGNVDYDFVIGGTTIPSPTLGNYPPSAVWAGSNHVNSPDAPPAGLTILTSYTSSLFSGVLTADPVTGAINITNANPPGTYTITVDAGYSVKKTFTLTVINPPCGANAFGPVSTISTATNPYAIAVGDFNKDEKQDLAITNFGSASVSIRLGNGLGGFTNGATVPVGTSPIYISVTDFNGDGNQDLAVVNNGSANVSVCYGNGSGAFPTIDAVSVGTNPTSLATGDFNNDGVQDFICANSISGFNTSISTKLGLRTGGFSSTPDVGLGFAGIRNIATCDLNMDGNLDFVRTTQNSASPYFNVYNGNGSGGFTDAFSDLCQVPYAVTICDFNLDGKQDLAISGSTGVSTFLGNGNGTLTIKSFIATGNSPYSMSVCDINADGFQDMAVANKTSNTVSLIYGNGTGIFTSGPNLTLGTNPAGIAVGDFNGDALPDLAVTNNSSSTVSIRTGINSIALTGNGNLIPDNSTIISASNNTDFGNVQLSNTVGRSYSITNYSTSSLTIDNISIGGALSSEFSVSGISLPATLSPNASVTFSISFSPLVTGINDATVHFTYSGCSSDYDFAIRGAGTSNCPPDISDNDVCTIDACDPFTGIVTHTLIDIDDFNACTEDACNSVAGVSHTDINIDDNDPCTVDACDPITGITHTVDYDDHNICTVDACNSITGISHDPVETDDQNACTDDGCDTFTGVYHNSVSTDDENACTNDGCNTLTGVYHSPVSVDDNNACTIDECNSLTGIYHTDVNVDDSNLCTVDGCDSVSGPLHTPVNADDGDVCTNDICDSLTGISHSPVNADDGNACTTDFCNSLTGVHHEAINIDDEDACTIDACNTVTGISHIPIDTDDNNLCTLDGCDSGSGVFHNPVNPDDGNACTMDGCDENTGNIFHNPVNIDDNDACSIDGCDTFTGTISHDFDTPLITLSIDSIACYGGTACVEVTAVNGLPPYFGTGIFCGYTVGQYILDVTDSRGCSVTETVNITEPEKILISTTSTPANCFLNDGSATASVSGGVAPYSYLWLPGNQSTEIVTGLATGDYTVLVTDQKNCTASANVIVESASSVPSSPGNINGATGVCAKQSNVVYCIQPVTNADYYSWTLPPGITAIGNLNGPCISVKITTKFKGGFICVKAVNTCGSSGATCLNVIRLEKHPSTPGTINGPALICPGQTAVYSTPLIGSATQYQWTSNGGLVIISGQGTNTITVSAPSNFNKSDLKVRAINCKGNSGWRTRKINKNTNCRLITLSKSMSSKTIDELVVYPNPTSGKFTIEFYTNVEAVFNLSIQDLAGNIILNEEVNTFPGINSRSVDIQKVAKGIYLISIQNSKGELSTGRIVVDK